MPVPTRREAARAAALARPARVVRPARLRRRGRRGVARARGRPDTGTPWTRPRSRRRRSCTTWTRSPRGRQPGTRHGDGSAAWLEAHGLGELGAARPRPPGDPARRRRGRRRGSPRRPLEARIVAYADKRAGQRLESMDDRFASWRRRYPSGPGRSRARRPAPRGKRGWDDETGGARRTRGRSTLEREICAAAGIAPREVRPPALGPPGDRARPRR